MNKTFNIEENIMSTIVINGTTYKLPASVVAQNEEAYNGEIYKQLFLQEIITGLEDFDRIDNEGGDWLESQCFAAYAEHHKIDEGDADISEVRESLFGWFSDYDKENFALYLLEKA